ncbi:11435_t:CDS:2, partial [Gigaspora margarita]
LLENIELQFCLAENEVQFEEKLKIFLSPVLKKLASPNEIVRKKVIEILNHIKKRMTNTVKLPWNSLIEIVHSDNFMNSTLVKNFTILYLKTAYDRLTEKDKITYLSPLIKNIELKPLNQKEFLFQIILELLQKSSLKLSDLETKESKLAANIFPEMLHVSFDCLFSPKTEINLQKQGTEFIQWIIRMVDTSRLELIGRVLLFGLLNIIKETKIENFKDLMTEQEINQTLLFRPFYGSLDLSIHNSEEVIDNEILKEIVIKFQEITQLDQFDQ